MRTRTAPNFANVYMGWFEDQFVTRHTGMSTYWTGYGLLTTYL